MSLTYLPKETVVESDRGIRFKIERLRELPVEIKERLLRDLPRIMRSSG